MPVSEWIMAEEGSKRVKIDGKDDKWLFWDVLWLVNFFHYSLCTREK